MSNVIRLTSLAQRGQAMALVATAPLGWVVTVKEEKRRDAQNRLFWEVMGDLANAEPEGRQWTKETWRDAILSAAGWKVEWEIGLDDSGPFPIGFRSSHLSVRQMSMVIEYAFSYGAKHGVRFTIDQRRYSAIFRTELANG